MVESLTDQKVSVDPSKLFGPGSSKLS
jgi:hypothetical protein